MDKPQIRKIPRTFWLNNQLAIPPSEKVKENHALHADLFSLGPFSALKLLEKSENSVRKLVRLKDSHIFHFVSDFSQVVKIIISALLDNQSLFQGRNHLVFPSHDQQLFINALRHHPGLATTYDWVTVNHEGRITEEQLIEALSPRSLLFSLSAAHGLTGVIQPLDAIVSLCKDRKILLHLDISDILGRVSLTPEILEADIITFSSAAIGGIGSIGGIFIHKSLEKVFSSWFPTHVAGSLCFSSVAAMQIACEERLSALPLFTFHTSSLCNKLVDELKQAHPSIQLIFSEVDNRLPNIVVAAIPDMPAESLAFYLHQQGIYPGLGYERFQPLAQVLQNCGVSPFLCHSALHFSLTERSKDLVFSTLTRALHDGIKHLNPLVGSSL
ncbi:Cysteine desulfurase,cysteine desulfurase,cysteine desulfurase NifS,Aminotransferase class-V [Chlamydia serpentis]|uniref:Cysteine desulfurase,cysteine desulfurase,cysteine desulfurase NifS,Aminotransferase class-V n=1 Tax=Chlamydia serpentis TaxID=1967782 RepID=A0A2R8FC28_9CHLA|nr:aminotransferase class V-fold PLP-dependent enzyme [Chlamydia serpentis]SPN73974.1 Cysteine desulfurase,cysteine desulfurase,cysteine desulfurase NifS,Aminotransferase class-V [Chlamydia serpentis]